nr:glutathione S-transferase A1-like [Equus caballus]
MTAKELRSDSAPFSSSLSGKSSGFKALTGSQGLRLYLENPGDCISSEKPRLHYFSTGGQMESIQWLLAAAGLEFEEKFVDTLEDFQKLKNDGSLMFQQVPTVEIDGMKLVQSRAILNYIATKHNLYGKDIKERAPYGISPALSSTINRNNSGPSLRDQDCVRGITTTSSVASVV